MINPLQRLFLALAWYSPFFLITIGCFATTEGIASLLTKHFLLAYSVGSALILAVLYWGMPALVEEELKKLRAKK